MDCPYWPYNTLTCDMRIIKLAPKVQRMKKYKGMSWVPQSTNLSIYYLTWVSWVLTTPKNVKELQRSKKGY